MRIIDISPPISPKLAVWPGDTPYRAKVSLSQAQGDNLDLSSIHTTVHVGAHADAPSHYAPRGQAIHERPLGRYLGLAEVVEVRVRRGQRVAPLSQRPRAPRVLLRTNTFPDPHHFNEDFAALSPALVHQLAGWGVTLVGIDTPSVDLFDDRELLSHRAIHSHDLAILEGLVLHHVQPGLYQLIALPLPLVAADASPVRAVLLPHSEGATGVSP